MIDHAAIRLRYEALEPILDERGRRRFAAAEALAAGRGGVTAVARITGVARSTIDRGLAELRGDAAPAAAPERVRRKGGGRRPLVVTDPSLLPDLKELVEPTTRGDPMAPLLWTAKSLRNLAAGLGALGHRVCHNVVADLLRDMGYSLQANHHRHRPQGAVRDRPQYLSGRRQSHRCRDGCHQHSAPRIPRRLELHNQPATAHPQR